MSNSQHRVEGSGSPPKRVEGYGSKLTQLQKEFRSSINRLSIEQFSNTPDDVLADYLISCLIAFGVGVNHRDSRRIDHE